MGCNCGQKYGVNRSAVNHVARSTAPPSVPVNIVQREQEQRIGPDSKNFCRICGWLLKKSKYIDVKTKAVVERIQCTNPKCSTNR